MPTPPPPTFRENPDPGRVRCCGPDGAATAPTLGHVTRTVQGKVQQWVLPRNCSLTPRQLRNAFLLLCGIEAPVALVFWGLGFPWVAFFSAVELTGVAVALLRYARHACDREIVTLEAERLRVECWSGEQVRRMELQAAWVRVAAAPGGLVLLSACGVELRVGRFVQPQWRDALLRELRQALAVVPAPALFRRPARAPRRGLLGWRDEALEETKGRSRVSLTPLGGLSPDANSPVDCLCLAKSWADGPARPARPDAQRQVWGHSEIARLPPFQGP